MLESTIIMSATEFTSKFAVKEDTGRRGGPCAPPGTRFMKRNWYFAILYILAAYSIAAFFCWVAVYVTYPYELDYGEGIVIWQAQHVFNLATAYAPITHYPFIVFHYTPLYQMVSFAVSKLTGDILLAGRLVSSISSLGLCLTLAWLVYRTVPARVSRLAAVGGATLALAFPCGLDAMKWAPLMRVDMLGLWLNFSGLAVFVLARSTAHRFFAFVLFVAAIYTRQTFVAGAATCLLVACILNFRQAVKMFVFTAALGGAILTALELSTHGEFVKHVFLYNMNRFSMQIALTSLEHNLQSMLLIVALAAAAAFSPIEEVARAVAHRNAAPLRARLSASPYRLALFTFTVYFMFSGLLSLSAGKSGGNINYFLELDLCACTLASLFVARLLWSWKANRLSSAFVLAYLLPILILGQQFWSASKLLKASYIEPRIVAQNAKGAAALEGILRNSPEPVMSEDMTLLYKAGKQVPFEPAIVAELTATQVWDETPLINLIRKQAFSVMIITDNPSVARIRYSPAVLRAVGEHYKFTESYAEIEGSYAVYVPAR